MDIGKLVKVGIIAVILIIGFCAGCQSGITAGSNAGRFEGSFTGVTQKLQEGLELGREEALKPENTVVSLDISTIIQETGKLEVLSAGVKLTDMNEFGREYKDLTVVKGDIVFTVDLSQCEVTQNDKSTLIVLPEPVADVYIDYKTTQVLDVIQKYPWSGNSADAATAFMNSIKATKEEMCKKVSNYDMLLNMARDSAEETVAKLASGVNVNDTDIKVICGNGNTSGGVEK